MENILVLRNPADLKPRSSIPRTHSKKQINQLRASIKKFHFIGVVLIDGNDEIIAGHGRCEAAKLEGLKEVPTLRVDHLTPEEIRAYVIADNKLAENAGWDRGLLALELNELRIEGLDAGILGFSSAETDALIQELKL